MRLRRYRNWGCLRMARAGGDCRVVWGRLTLPAAAAAATPGGGRIRGRGCKRLSTHRSYHVSRTHADLVVFMPAVNHVEGLICRWLLWTGINACSASHFVTANAHHPPLPPLPLPIRPHPRPSPSSFGHSNISEWPVVARWFVLPLCQFF